MSVLLVDRIGKIGKKGVLMGEKNRREKGQNLVTLGYRSQRNKQKY